MIMLDLTCPYCGRQMSVENDGLFTPRYHHCGICREKFIYAPQKMSAATYRLGEADCYTDPELREIEFSGYDEQ